MSKSNSTAVYPTIQARRINAAPLAEFLARLRRDLAFVALGLAPESIALIGGSDCITVADGAKVSAWLWMVGQRTKYNRPAETLYSQMETDRSGYMCVAPTAVALSRRMLERALSLVEAEKPLTDMKDLDVHRAVLAHRWQSAQLAEKSKRRQSSPHETEMAEKKRKAWDDYAAKHPLTLEPVNLGVFWAISLELAELSEDARKLYRELSTPIAISDETVKESLAVLHKTSREAEAAANAQWQADENEAAETDTTEVPIV